MSADNQKIKFNFVNIKNGENKLPCGCNLSFSDGRGQYSDVYSFIPCKKHSPISAPEKDGSFDGYYFSAGGNWIKR